MRLALSLCIILVVFAGAACGDIWIGLEGSLNKYADDGETLKVMSQYRNPVALTADHARNRLWFVDQYDYTLICLDAETGEEIYRMRDVASKPGTDAVSTDLYSSDGIEPAPAMAVYEADGSLWVADLYAHQIVKLDVYGEEVLRKSGFRQPYLIAVEPETGNVWVNSGESQLLRLDDNGERWDKRSGVNRPRTAAVCPQTGDIWVADYGNCLVRIMEVSGKLLENIDVDEPPVSLCINDDGTAWVIMEYEIALLLDDAGNELAEFDRLEKPFAIDGDGSGSVWVLDPAPGEAVHIDANGDKVRVISGLNGALSIAVF